MAAAGAAVPLVRLCVATQYLGFFDLHQRQTFVLPQVDLPAGVFMELDPKNKLCQKLFYGVAGSIECSFIRQLKALRFDACLACLGLPARTSGGNARTLTVDQGTMLPQVVELYGPALADGTHLSIVLRSDHRAKAKIWFKYDAQTVEYFAQGIVESVNAAHALMDVDSSAESAHSSPSMSAAASPSAPSPPSLGAAPSADPLGRVAKASAPSPPSSGSD
jgi:hypothetical protein